MPGTPDLDTISTKQMRIAKLAADMPGAGLKTLAHHIDLDWLRAAYARTRKDGAVGVDGQTAEQYASNLEANLADLLERAKSGRYRAPAVRRVNIPKGNGKFRPLGVPTFEDKILQTAVKMVLEPVYEQDFHELSYGFRPRRSAHQALDALREGLRSVDGGYVLDADVQSFFDDLDHAKLRDILRKRVLDGVLVRLIGKWLNAGVLDGGVIARREKGTPQGGVISPLLANIYLHEVLDEWWLREVQPRLKHRAGMVRYADDFVMFFQSKDDALRVFEVLPQRFARFGLTLHAEKTRLLDFRKPTHRPPQDGGPGTGSAGGGGPEGFNFLGFTHHWGRSRRGSWVLRKKTMRSRLARSIRAINEWCRRLRHLPLAEQAKGLAAKLRGHYAYFGVTGNMRALKQFYRAVERVWKRWLSRRSQRGFWSWLKFRRKTQRFRLPTPRIVHSIYR